MKQLRIVHVAASGKRGMAVVEQTIGFATIEVATGWLTLTGDVTVGDTVDLPVDTQISSKEGKDGFVDLIIS